MTPEHGMTTRDVSPVALHSILDRKIVDARRTQSRFSALLARIDTKAAALEQNLESGLEFVHMNAEQIVRDAIRDCDEIYHLGDGGFLLILADTYEAGADSLALRLKKALTKSSTKLLGTPLCFAISTYSDIPAANDDASSILSLLEKNLEHENVCQLLPARRPEDYCRGIMGPVYLMGLGRPEADKIVHDLGTLEYQVISFDSTDNALKSIESMDALSVSVVVIGEKIRGDISNFTKNLRLNRKLDCIYVISYEDINGPDEVIDPGTARSAEFLIQRIMAGYHAMLLRRLGLEQGRMSAILDSIGTAAHKLNQPLQVIMGKLELLLLDIVTPENAKGIYEDIQAQVFRAGEINQKIGRLSKYSNKDS